MMSNGKHIELIIIFPTNTRPVNIDWPLRCLINVHDIMGKRVLLVPMKDLNMRKGLVHVLNELAWTKQMINRIGIGRILDGEGRRIQRMGHDFEMARQGSTWWFHHRLYTPLCIHKRIEK